MSGAVENVSHGTHAFRQVEARPYDRAEQEWALALHEAGHAVAGELLGVRSIHAYVGDGARVEWEPQADPLCAEGLIRVHLAGSAAEMLFLGRARMAAPGKEWQDMDRAQRVAEKNGLAWDADAAVARCVEFLRPHKATIRDVAAALRARGELSGDDVRSIMRAHRPRRRGRARRG
jgi:hypothetical protein